MDAIYKNFFRPILFRLDAEQAHEIALSCLEFAYHCPVSNLLRRFFTFEDPALQVQSFGLTFANPVGLAAGFDKNAAHMPALSRLGFGFLEAGTITFHPQPGNPKPRIKRIPEAQALWNWLGFNNDGARAVASRLKQMKPDLPFGINIGKSKIASAEKAVEDYLESFDLLSPYGDYFALNVSSPNTPGLRALQEKEKLEVLLSEIQKRNTLRKPLLVKVAPDVDFPLLDSILEVALRHGAAGIIATNTTLSRTGISRSLPAEGGISGAPLRKRSTEIIRYLYQRAGKQMTIIGCGGIFSAEDAFEKIQAGASLVQVYTGLIYEGPRLIRNINRGLAALLRRRGFSSVQEAVGASVK